MKNLVFIILTLLLSLFNVVLFAEEKPKEWSEYQGKLSWKGATIKCESIGMRPPTIQELKVAYNTKLPKAWEEKGDYYWTAHEYSRTFEDAYCFNIISGEHSISYRHVYKHVRCVR
ncbi:MAG: DUF1566 domain-containing protein [Leptospiraceae bacterium]|nr:DUF1566 domain-containing protein [Leptospiraceae bacterium]